MKLIAAATAFALAAAHIHVADNSTGIEGRTCGTEHNEVEIAEATSIADRVLAKACGHPVLGSKLRACLPYEERVKQPVEIPVWYHVIHDGNTGRLTERQVNDQFAQTNKDFLGDEGPGGYKMDIIFKLAGTTYTDNAAWFSNVQSNEVAIKNALAVDNRYNFNQYFGNFRLGLLGFCYFPNSYPESSPLHGCMNLYSSVPGGSSNNYNEGKTTTHETGHGIGLYHTFQGGCSGQGDQVADTCPQRSSTNGCPRDPPASCQAGCPDPIHNYMDYSYDSCMYEFTRGQSERANAQLFANRPSLYNSAEEMDLIQAEMPDLFIEAQGMQERSAAKKTLERNLKYGN